MLTEIDTKKLYYFANVWGCPVCKKISGPLIYTFTQAEKHKATFTSPYFSIDYRPMRNANSRTETYSCPLCKHVIYETTKDSWSKEADQLFELVKKQGRKEGVRLETLGDDLHFLSGGGKDIDACRWFLDIEYEYLLGIYNSWLEWNGYKKKFPPVPPRLLGIEKSKKPAVEKPNNHFAWNWVVGERSAQNLDINFEATENSSTAYQL